MPTMQFRQQVLQPLVQNFNLHPDAHAFFIKNQYYTYLQLSETIQSIRTALQSHSQSHQTKIAALLVNDDIETYASILALWFEGYAYVPLHPLQPDERNLNIIQQTQPALLLHSQTTSTLVDTIKQHTFETLCTTQLTPAGSMLLHDTPTDDRQLAYILFTSGSTGAPKGVCISRLNLASFLHSFGETGITITPTDRCLQTFDLTFDVSIQAFLIPLLKGACVYTVPYGQIKYIHAAALLMEHQLTFAPMAPSMLTYLKPYFGQIDLQSLKTTILTAEACPIDLTEDWYRCATNTDIYDFYGPTEGTIYCTYYKLHKKGQNLAPNGIVAIGKPMPGITAAIIDENNNILPSGQKGELCIAGNQITQGYWQNAEQNRQIFISLKSQDKTTQYYRTGDLCSFTDDGNLLYYGRIDQQAKIQGYRVELGEIEYHARKYYGNDHRSIAIAYTDNANLTEIALFIEKKQSDTNELKAYLQTKLPPYMIPSTIIYLESFPLNKSEKIDRTALKKLLS